MTTKEKTKKVSKKKKEELDDFTSDLIKSLNKERGSRVAYNLSTDESPTHVKRWISTGSKQLDYIISKEGIPLPDFIKIDIEGFEFDALMGMENLLKNKKPELFIEIHGATRTEKESNILKIVSLLKKHNYDIQLVETNEIITIENTVKAREGHIYCY